MLVRKPEEKRQIENPGSTVQKQTGMLQAAFFWLKPGTRGRLFIMNFRVP
jgi:hypothetical protein